MHCNFWTQILCVVIMMKVAVISKFLVYIYIGRNHGHTAPPLINKLGVLMCYIMVCLCILGFTQVLYLHHE